MPLLLFLASQSLAVELVRGPYLQQTTTDATIVVFELDEASPAEVRIDGEREVASPEAVHHEVVVDGLTADTTYTWAVEVGQTPLTEGLTLRTAAAPGAPLSFLVLGDTRTEHEAHASVIAAAADSEGAFLVHTGDLVSDGLVAEQWDQFFSIEQPLLERMPLWPVVGNHDEEGGDASLYQAAFALPGNELYYSFDWSHVHFVVLDGHVSTTPICLADDETLAFDCFDEEQLAWLEADLAAACARPEIELSIVFVHIGPYTSVSDRTGNVHLRVLLPLLAQHGVAAVISGHDHYYERGISDQGLPYVVTGGGGAPLYELEEPDDAPHERLATASVHHFVRVEVDGRDLSLAAVDTEGTVFDTASWTAADTCVPVVETEDTGDGDEQERCGCATPAAPPWVLVLLLAALIRRRR